MPDKLFKVTAGAVEELLIDPGLKERFMRESAEAEILENAFKNAEDEGEE